MKLRELEACFQGIVPAILATCDREGVPNVSYLSQMQLVDDRHVALSCQFFNKTRRNLDENPQAAAFVLHPVTYAGWRLRLRYLRSETSGPLFDSMALRIEAIASHTGMKGVFKLLSADVCEVVSIEPVDGFLVPTPPGETTGEPSPGHLNEIRSLQIVSERINRAPSLECVIDVTLETLDELFGFRHGMVLLAEDDGTLVAIGSRGYGAGGIGAEVQVGDGLIGTAARERKVLRHSGVDADLRYGRAVRGEVVTTDGPARLRPEIPLPGLPDARSQLAIPLLLQDRLVGVLALESRDPCAFADWHEAFLQVVGNQIAMAIDRRSSGDAAWDRRPVEEPPVQKRASAPAVRRFCFYRSDDCVFLDGEYLVRNVPGRILWKLLAERQRDGRTEFANRELRLDPFLQLPAVKDNLESRLILLRKRLQERCPDVRLVPTRRGRFALEIDGPFELEERDRP